jgi:integrase
MFERRKRQRHRVDIQAYLDRKGMRVDAESFERIKNAVDVAMWQAREQVHRYAQGDYRPDPDADRFPPLDVSELNRPRDGAAQSTSPTAVFDRYAAEAKLSPSTIKRWRHVMRDVEREVPDLRRLSRDWCIAWKDRLIAGGRASKTVREVYLASLRATCSWAIANGILAENPVVGVTLKVAKAPRLRPQGYTDEEALTALRATLQPPPPRLSRERAHARRWVPWLCAYSGARIAEITQLRKEDIRHEADVWLMWITPEAGGTKGNAARYVAIHPDLIEQGFIQFVQACRDGPLFYDPRRGRGGATANPQHTKVGEHIARWMRAIGLDDPRVRPNHAWRHRFKTLARKVRMDVGARDYMQGHAPGSEGEAYGDFEPDVLLHEISKLPRFALDCVA